MYTRNICNVVYTPFTPDFTTALHTSNNCPKEFVFQHRSGPLWTLGSAESSTISNLWVSRVTSYFQLGNDSSDSGKRPASPGLG